MPAEIRRRAKAINFGIIYGISAFGLANQLGIPRGEADAYIKKYFERFPGIRDYMESTKAFVREHGYVETIFGRRIHIRDVKAQSAAHRAFGERQAINAPIPGFGRRHHPPRHGASARRAGRERSRRAAIAAGA
jgi:DNA polymerase-1